MGKMKDMASTPVPATPVPAPMVMPKPKSVMMALPEADDPWMAIANEGGGQFGNILSFRKGEYFCGDDEVALGTQFLVLMTESMRGYVRFEGRKPVDYRLNYCRDNVPMPRREDLGFTDPAFWEKDNRGEPNDPWVERYYLPMQRLEDGELYTFAFNSDGAKRAFRALAREYSPYRKSGKLPIMSLQASDYPHPDWGKVDVPVLQVEDWSPAVISAEAPAANDEATSSPPAKLPKNADMDDDIPF